MTTIANVGEALATAEDALVAHGTARSDLKESLAGYVERLTNPEAPYACLRPHARRHINLAQLLLALDLKERSHALAAVTLRHMELAEADQELYAADTWNELGSLLAEHDDLDRARMVLNYALNRAQRAAAPELARILANLSAVSLRAGHLEDAKIWAQKAVTVLGRYYHQETLVAQAALAAAEFDAADGTAFCASRRHQAVSLLDSATARAARTLGRDHSQTLALRAALADMRGATAPADELPYLIEHVYTPQENSARNKAKGDALRHERNVIRLVAHAGASFFLKDLKLFHPQIIHALNQGSYFYAIISSPWNNLAIFTKHDATAERPNSHNIVDIIAASDYYSKTFLHVIDAYRTLRETYHRIELRLTHIDIPGSTLLTTDRGFFEPYITSNPERRTRRKLNVLEVEFHKDSRYYADSRAEFDVQWELASTLDQFEASEEQHKTALRDAVRAQSDDRLKGDGEPRP